MERARSDQAQTPPRTAPRRHPKAPQATRLQATVRMATMRPMRQASTGVTLVPAFKWADQSGLGNDATVAVGSGPPDRNTAGTSPRAGFGFHETEALVIADAPSLQWGTGDFLIETVAANNSSRRSATPVQPISA